MLKHCVKIKSIILTVLYILFFPSYLFAGQTENANAINTPELCRGCDVREYLGKPLVGVWYFDGWADTSNSNPHLYGKSELMKPRWGGRKPLTGWYDNNPETIEIFSDFASKAGLGFWAFEWFPGDKANNTALENYIKSPIASKKMKFAVGYINGAFSDAVTPKSWQGWCEYLTKNYFVNPSYVHANGKPIFYIYKPSLLDSKFSHAGGLSAAIKTLRNTARAAGLELEIVSLDGVSPSSVLAGIDSYTYYSVMPTPSEAKIGTVSSPAENPYSLIVSAGKNRWSQLDAMANKYGFSYIPVVTTGWDNRPWGRYEGQLMASAAYTVRSPYEVADFYSAAADWAWSHASKNPNPEQPIVLLESWNEIGEGAYILPTYGDGFSYLIALARKIPK